MTAKTAVELIYDLINEDNQDMPQAANASNVSLGTPIVNPDGGIAKNTKLIVTAINGQGYNGSQALYYDRIELDAIVASGTPGSDTFQLTNVATVADFLPAYNARFAVNLSTDDVVAGSLPAPDENQRITFILHATSSALTVTGSVVLKIDPASVQLNTVITQPILTGFTLPQLQTPVGIDTIVTDLALSGFNLPQLQAA